MKAYVKSFICLLAALSIFNFNSSAQELEVPVPVPAVPATLLPMGPITIMEFEESSYDFGFADEGEVVTNVYTFTNTGNEPLVLLDAKGSCGCTVPQWPKSPIAPGETASITVEFNTKNKRGLQSKRVTIKANTDPPQTFLTIKGEVIASGEEIELDPSLPEIEVAEEKIDPDCFAIFPNPTSEILKLEVEEQSYGKSAIISIHSKTGQLMAKKEVPVLMETIEFSVSHYPAGTYIANVKIGDSKPEARCFVVVD